MNETGIDESGASETGTRGRILDAAEVLFAEEGFDGTTLRRVTGAAAVNLAAVHYHFGSKEGLLQAVLHRRLGPINDARLALLERFESAGVAPSLEAVVEAFVRPPIEIGKDTRTRLFVRRLLGRLYTDQGAEWLPVFFEQFKGVKERFAPAMRACLPRLTDAEFGWRMHFAIGAMAHVMGDECRIQEISGGACDPSDTEEVISQLVAFVVAGLRAPSVLTPARKEGEA